MTCAIITTRTTPMQGLSFGTSSTLVCFQRETLTTVMFKTSPPAILLDTPAVTSSPELASGLLHSAGPDGRASGKCGQDHALASLSARQAKERGLLTSGTCGRHGTTLSASAALTRSLGNRLEALTASRGSILYRLTWKHRDTPAGRRICALRASARPTSASASSGWPTLKATNGNNEAGNNDYSRQGAMDLQTTAQHLVGWATPQARDHFPPHTDEYVAAKKAQGHGMQNLNDQVMQAGWPTPMAGTPAQNGNNAAGNNDYSRQVVSLCTGWATPLQSDWRGSPGVKPHSELPWQTEGAGWATPATRDYRTPNHQTYTERSGSTKGEQLNNQVAHLIPGASLNGLPAATESKGLLNPAFSRWLQGIPATWDACAPTETRSILMSRKRSFVPFSSLEGNHHA